MIQREDIVLLTGAAVGATLIVGGALTHDPQYTTIGLGALAAGMGGKAVIPNIAPSVTATPAAVVGSVVTIDGKNYVLQADGTYKPQ